MADFFAVLSKLLQILLCCVTNSFFLGKTLESINFFCLLREKLNKSVAQLMYKFHMRLDFEKNSYCFKTPQSPLIIEFTCHFEEGSPTLSSQHHNRKQSTMFTQDI